MRKNMNDYLVLVTPEMGCAFRWSPEFNQLEYCPLLKDGGLEGSWSCIEEFLVGEEPVTFRGIDVTLSQVYRYAEKVLKPKESV